MSDEFEKEQKRLQKLSKAAKPKTKDKTKAKAAPPPPEEEKEPEITDDDLKEDDEQEEQSSPDAIDDIDEAWELITSGENDFEFRSKVTGKGFTYRTRMSDNSQLLFVSIKIEDGDKWPFKYFGIIKIRDEGQPFIHGRQGKAKIEEDHPGAVAFLFGWNVIKDGLIHKDLEVRKVVST